MIYRVLFAGGCHIDPMAGAGPKLSEIGLRILENNGFCCEAEYLSQARLSHPRRIVHKCKDFAPDLLVLQCGHPETSNLVSSYIHSALRRSADSRHTLDSTTALADAFDGSLRVGLKWFLKKNAKVLFDVATRHRLVNFSKLGASLEECFRRVSACAVPAVVVLSPLPCADPVSVYYRRALRPLFREAADRYQFHFLDVLDIAADRMFLDPIHLNAAGHRAVGEATGKYMLQVLSELRSGAAAFRQQQAQIDLPLL